jgi:hypothetical protein
MFQFIVLLFYNIVSIHVADLLIMFCFCNTYFLLMSICLIFVLHDLQKLSSWIIYKVHVHVHILPNQDWLIPEYSICYYWSPDIGITILFKLCTNKNHSYEHNGQINNQNIDNSECFGVKFVKIYPKITSQ